MNEQEMGATRADATKDAFDAHYERLFRMVLLLVRDREEAEDIVQEAFVRSIPRLPSLHADERGPYLRMVVVNEWRSRARRLRTRARRLPLVASRHSVTEDRDDALDLWALTLGLPPRQRATLVLRYYEDLSEEDTAKVLGCSVGTVKSQLNHAIANLRRRYGDDRRR